MRLLIECTYVYDHPQDNSGIQRVVRNIISCLDAFDGEVECIPVMMHDQALYKVLSLEPLPLGRIKSIRQRMIVFLEHLRNRYWWWHSRLEKISLFSRVLLARRLLYWPCKIFSFFFTLPLQVLYWLNRKDKPAPQRAVEFSAKQGDQLLLLDSSWHADFFVLAESLKSQGIGLIAVIYDLIPLTHPEFCDAGLVKVFDRWFDWVSKTADGFVTISQTINEQVSKELERRLGSFEASKRWCTHFYLGSELDLKKPAAVLHRGVRRLFEGDAHVYLMVSTIEPRKNHDYLLDAFELLWAKGIDVKLSIVGKVGWKCDALVDRIKQHVEYNRRLFMFNKVNDKTLEFAYEKSRALVFPSYAEGFGLPIVEAMERRLPVMVSDISVFREIRRDFVVYFDLKDPLSLCEKIETYERENIFPAERNIDEWEWIDWEKATEQLINGVLQGIRSTARQANAHIA